jgi:hypothetical protein
VAGAGIAWPWLQFKMNNTITTTVSGTPAHIFSLLLGQITMECDRAHAVLCRGRDVMDEVQQRDAILGVATAANRLTQAFNDAKGISR